MNPFVYGEQVSGENFCKEDEILTSIFLFSTLTFMKYNYEYVILY